MITIEVLRLYKVGPFAIFDFAASYLGMLLLSPLLTKIFSKLGIFVPWTAWLWLTLPLSVLFHLIYHQNTPFMKILASPYGFLTIAPILIAMVFLGLKDIRKIKNNK